MPYTVTESERYNLSVAIREGKTFEQVYSYMEFRQAGIWRYSVEEQLAIKMKEDMRKAALEAVFNQIKG